LLNIKGFVCKQKIKFDRRWNPNYPKKIELPNIYNPLDQSQMATVSEAQYVSEALDQHHQSQTTEK
jgi:hypothetical protein